MGSSCLFICTLLCIYFLHITNAASLYNSYSNSTNSTYWEQQFLTLPNAMNTKEHLRFYTSIPHIAGSPGDYQTALYTKNQFESFGLTDVVIEELEVLLNYPVKRIVETVPLNGEPKFVAQLQEPVVPEDPTSNNTESVATFNGFSPSGNVTAELVYANFGLLDDYKLLESIGVNVSGKIVIVKYGNSFRGVKAMIAQQYGAAGLLIYSDPANDGYGRNGGVYPDGPWRPEQGVQRGSVQYLQICPGNPLNNTDCLPNGGDISGVLIPNIPVQPISWGDAEPLLKGITNNVVPKEWKWAGGLNITYAIGPGPVVVHLETEMNFNVTTIWNVIATLPGQDTSKTVYIGNHRDAWVFGATDPNSGTSVMLEIARSYGVLASQGWKPKRNITFCSWDAEEYSLIGSTGFAKQYKDNIAANAIAYLNVDIAVGGTAFGAGATPTLRTLIEDVAASVPYPGNPNISIMQHWGPNKLAVLGSGSDYTAFIHHLGVASMDVGFGGISGGVYHSIYDSFYWMENFGDKDFLFHRGMAQFLGLAGMRLVDSVVIPWNYTNYAAQLLKYTNDAAAMLNATIGAPDVGISIIESAIAEFSTISETIQNQQLSQNLDDVDGVSNLNSKLVMAERSFLNPEGLPGRPFYKHVVQAPELYSGYNADTFPGLVQAIRDQNWVQATEQTKIIADHISAVATALQGPTPTPEPKPGKPNNKTAMIVIIIVAVVSVAAFVGGVVYYMRNKKIQYQKV